MNFLVDKTNIQEYAKRNTSAKMPIEQLYVQAFIDSLLNSTKTKECYQTLQDIIQDGNAFVLFSSFNPTANIINKEPYRSILAYAMLKKDFRLFELISASMFTGTVHEYHGTDLMGISAKTTDETPQKFTDTSIYTDPTEGMINIGFKNIFTTEILPDGTGSEYQTYDELLKALDVFDVLITLTKPARINVLTFHIPFCFISGNLETQQLINVTPNTETNPDVLINPLMDEDSVSVLDNTSDAELSQLYNSAVHIRYQDEDKQFVENLPLSFVRTEIREEGFTTFQYEFRTSKLPSLNTPWYTIMVQPGVQNKVYNKTSYKGPDGSDLPGENKKIKYFEKYNPIMLRIEDNKPNSPCLAAIIEDGVCTVGAMFYVRDKIRLLGD